MENSQALPSSNKAALYAEWEQWKKNGLPDERRAEAVSKMRRCYEENEESLYLSYMGLLELPTLPDFVKRLDISYNQLTRLPALPGSLKELGADHNQLPPVSV